MLVKNKLPVETPEFWDEGLLLKEELRQFDICHGCRLCFSFCPAFPSLFDITDAKEEGRTTEITRQDLRVVEDSCYQCKLCYVRCPYTEPHQLDMDIPRLLTRAKLLNKKKDGLKFGDRFLADVELTGKLGTGPMAPIANMTTNMAPVRFLMKHALGVHPKAQLPKFQTSTFASWFKKYGEGLSEGFPEDAPTIALFYTCTVNYSVPEVGIAAAQVLAHNGVRVTAPEQKCCGMPFLDAAILDRTLDNIKANVGSLEDVVKRGHEVVALSPSCSLTMKQEYPQLVETEGSRLVAKHTFDISEYLWKLKLSGKMKTRFKPEFGAKVNRIGYHAPCHIRAQYIGNRGASLMELIPGVSVEQVEQCCHHDGTWGVKADSRDISLKYAQKLFNALNEAEAHLLVSDCPLASNQIEVGTGKRPVHPVQVLKEAYGI